MDLVCFSHLRWDFVYQRPQHLLTRFSKNFRVFYVEEPVYGDENNAYLITQVQDNLWRVIPQLKKDLSGEEAITIQQNLLSQLFYDYKIENYIFWYYTPMALSVSKNFKPGLIVYDCMDELSNFKFAPASLKELEQELFKKADVVFTGGHSLYKAKKDLHNNIHPFPSSIDKAHFSKARTIKDDPKDQALIPAPRFGFYGVIDERFDLELLQQVADEKPEWHFIIIGPVVKIDPDSLPKNSNIHYLGNKTYAELPLYLSGWDVALIPFLLNDSTKYISPTKTPEYLAAGKPVISTGIKDVIIPYGVSGVVHIADSPENFISKAEKILNTASTKQWLSDVDTLLADNSWDNTWSRMMEIIDSTSKVNQNLLTNLNEEAYV